MCLFHDFSFIQWKADATILIVFVILFYQVGAGTMNPLTFLRVLGPEPWNVA